MVTHSSTDTTELLPCPFCGGSRVGMGSSIAATEWSVICSDCGASCSASCESHDDAIASWNTRASITTASGEAATPTDYVLVPRELTAENGAKSALIGEFSETFDYMDDEGDECQAEIPVSWTTIKEIHKKMVALFARSPDPAQAGRDPATIEAHTAVGTAK